MSTIKAVLLDLDGTLLDTAPDLAAALNIQLAKHGLDDIPFAQIRPIASHGSKALVKLGFKIDETHPDYPMLRQEYLSIYSEHSGKFTDLFPGMADVLAALAQQKIIWGIVTNKPGWLTFPLLKKLQLIDKAGCVVCGDTVSKNKPHPAPLLYACELLDYLPEECIYIGDAEFDIVAGKRAGMRTVLAKYGYITCQSAAASWGADVTIEAPLEILKLLN